MDKFRIDLQELLLCISNAQELVSNTLTNHQQKVAYLSYRLAEQLCLAPSERENIFHAALVHDVGALSVDERLAIIETEPMTIYNHGYIGANLLEEFKPMKEAANIIRYHHLPWRNGEGIVYMGNAVPFGSHIIHLADRTCARIKTTQNILSQLPEILGYINYNKGTVFAPPIVEALNQLSRKEYIWLDLISRDSIRKLPEGIFNILVLDIDDVIDLSYVFSHIIDFRSKFTARHSAGVAKTSQRLAEMIGFSPLECKMMLIAGYLHDLGKLAISNDVLEKPAKLNEDEFNEIRSHTYYTYQLLDTIPQFETIKTWAAFHHERLNGSGYPFHIKGDSLTLGSRIMAVADIFTAITESRPYRKGMDDQHAIHALKDMVASEAIDGNIVKVLIDHFQEINDIRESAQQQASNRYESFLHTEAVL